MKNIKRSIISAIIMLVVILGICTTSIAYYVGQYVDISYNDYVNNNNIYCVEHNQALTTFNSYQIISEVTIEGTKSTDHNGGTQESWHNAKLAYILSSNDSSAVQNEVWNYMRTWLDNVGKNHAGLRASFSNGVRGSATSLDIDASNYANNLGDTTKIKDNTNKDNIKALSYEKDGKSYMKIGPFNWTFSGTMQSIEVKDQNGNGIKNTIYSSYTGTEEKWFNVDGIKSGKDFYISVPTNTNITKITKITGRASVTVKGVKIWFLEALDGYKQNLIIREPYDSYVDIETSIDVDIPLLGDLKIIKVNEDNQEIKLQGVGFVIQHSQTGKYLSEDRNGKITYVEGRKNAKEWETDENGEILLENITVGNYIAYETKNPNYGYEIKTEGTPAKVTSEETARVVTIGNKQIYTKLSGFVWEDKPDSKTGDTKDNNALFKEPYTEQNKKADENDILFDGIIVRLVDKTTGETVQETTTSELGRYKEDYGHNGHGEYLFENVLIEKLGDYYIQFEYDGLTYTNVLPLHIDKDNGSKSAESDVARKEFNAKFATVEGTRQENGTYDGYTKNTNGNRELTLGYDFNELEHSATLSSINNESYITIKADTNVAQYIIKDHFTYGQEEIKYINLGLNKREQPRLAIKKDIQNVRLTINGYEHTYTYAQRFLNAGEYGDGFNVGVKFGEKSAYNGMKYTQAIYKSDYDYKVEDESQKSRELKTYITYRIAVINQSVLKSKINSLVDYYDSRFRLVAVGTQLDEKGNVKGTVLNSAGDLVGPGDMSYSEGVSYNDSYTKSTINTNITLNGQEIKELYVQFALTRSAVYEILEAQDSDIVDNVIEINSYSIYDDNGDIYAGIDTNSAPGSSIPGDERTYEGDTDTSPTLLLEVADAREMKGKVFLDGTSPELMTGKERLGNGKYDNNEQGIEGVKVTLTENSGSGKEYTQTTDANGDFNIKNYIPGDYTLTYTWGNETYTVQNYKGTIYDNTRNQNNKNWYKENSETRLTDAIDNYEKPQEAPKGSRLQIDEELKNITNKTQITRTKMDSTTPTMGIGIELLSETSSYGDELKFIVENIDFGIVERPRQELALIKRVKTMKITLANGQILANVEIDENGNMTGNNTNVTYMAPDPKMHPSNGYIKAELDNELIQGAIVEVGYSIKAINQSEIDYISEGYYKYGIQKDNKVTITPTEIIDYLDKDWSFSQENNPEWKTMTLEELKNGNIVAKEVYDNEQSTIKDKIILYTESLKDKQIEPAQSVEVMLNVSKQLSTTAEISLDNEAEMLEVNKTGGSKIASTPGNYIPGTEPKESDESMAETTNVTPGTGGNQNYIIGITIGIMALLILGTGIVIIKKKVIDKNK